MEIMRETSLLDRPSGAPHAEFEREAVEAFQGIRAELDELHNRDRRILDMLAALSYGLAAFRLRQGDLDRTRWSRFRAWFRRNIYDWRAS
jgi:hypothetical protein